jgi:predicted nucleic acid-binding protein
VTVAPVLTEAFHLLFRVPSGPERLFELIDSIAVEISPLDVSLLGRVRVLMNKYSNVPMSFADAVLVAVAERERIDTIFTLDRRGFDTYKPSHISRLRII